MILVIWQNIPEEIHLFELPATEEHIRVCTAAHGKYLGVENEGPGELLALLEGFPKIYSDGHTGDLPVKTCGNYSLVVVSGHLL